MRKLAIAVSGFSAAILISYYFLSFELIIYFAITAAVLSALGFLLKGSLRLRVFIFSLSLSVGFLWSFTYTSIFIKPHYEVFNELITATAVVKDYPVSREPRGYHVDVSLKHEGMQAIGTRLYYYDEAVLTPGDTITFTARFKRTDITDDGERLDTLSSRGLFLSGYVSGNINITKTSNSLIYLPKVMANKIGDKINEIFSQNVSHFLQAVLMGKRDSLYKDPALHASLSASGIIHVVSISGMHISFLMGFLSVVIKNKRLFALYGIPVLFLFMAMTGFTPAVTRAGIMQIFIIIAPMFKRDGDSITALCAALLVLLASNPYACASVGLQLSFTATAGIIFFTSKIRNTISDSVKKSTIYKKKIPRVLINYTTANIGTTIGALIFTLPLTAIHFGYVSLIAPITNLFTIGVISFIFPVGLIVTALGFISPFIAGILAAAVNLSAHYVVFIAQTFARVPYSVVYSTNILIMFWLAYVYILFSMLPLFKARPRQYIYPVCISIILLFSVILLSLVFPSSAGESSLTVLDVGQGLSVILFSGDYTMIVDCGSNSGIRAGEIAHEYLLNHGRTSIDVMVITHFHSDHINGIEFLLSRVNVSVLIIPDPEGSYAAEDIISLARKHAADIIYVTQELSISLGETEVILLPPLGFGDENERGIAVLTTGNINSFITGDMNSSTERALLRAYKLPELDILVVGHHGSRNSTSEELLSNLRPSVAVIPVGRNSFGHPHNDTLLRLFNAGVNVYRTDEAGHITVSGR